MKIFLWKIYRHYSLLSLIYYLLSSSLISANRRKAAHSLNLTVHEIGSSSLSSLGFFADGRVKSQIVSVLRSFNISFFLFFLFDLPNGKLYAHLPSLLRNSALLLCQASTPSRSLRKETHFVFALCPVFSLLFYISLSGTRQKAQCALILAVREIGSSSQNTIHASRRRS